MKLLDLMIRNNKIQCYPYCIGLKYDRSISITDEQWDTKDVNVIAEVILTDLKKLNIPSRIVDKNYTPSTHENLLALKVCMMWIWGKQFYDIYYHIVVKRQDGYWYSKFDNQYHERLPLGTNVESWIWRKEKINTTKKYFNTKTVYIAVSINL